MKVVDAIWFTNGSGCIGIVMVKDNGPDPMFYISSVLGHHEEDDREFVMNYGATFPFEAGLTLFGVKRHAPRE